MSTVYLWVDEEDSSVWNSNYLLVYIKFMTSRRFITVNTINIAIDNDYNRISYKFLYLIQTEINILKMMVLTWL